MKKYNIEGGINFFEELYKSLDDVETINKTEEDDNLCLITYKPLQDKFVKLNCGHKFNYIPLYYDIKNHKQKFNHMEGNSGRLNQNQVRCPYCREIQENILDYYEGLGLPKVNGVNYIDPNYKASSNNYNSSYKPCQYLSPNALFDPNGNNVVETSSNNSGNCKFLKCFCSGTKISYTDKKDLLNTNFGDEKYYCWNHSSLMTKKYKTEYYHKKKEEQTNIKLKLKEELKKKKEEDKLKTKEDKIKAREDKIKIKEELKKIVLEAKLSKILNSENHDNENLVIGEININTMCTVLIKSGPNKGNICGNKIVENGHCKRHCIKVKHNSLNNP
jgi:hypothetical protein